LGGRGDDQRLDGLASATGTRSSRQANDPRPDLGCDVEGTPRLAREVARHDLDVERCTDQRVDRPEQLDLVAQVDQPHRAQPVAAREDVQAAASPARG
jgi:hypothetical protein